ncbi:hypothetical protein GA0070616_1698 [Micromonospora nigra]|uniref:Integral membrane protein n=1 Tax=Micromonospora nigra TaxID=145857 RepID=A0A1C6RPV8_9ACTN|nr:hypothetical protein [Micromonospora nigra]SCL19243.1 hypothetical protein GA0070616_1698 [Micromonospora nigra]
MGGRILELRVHGVSNTPPHQTLGLAPEPTPPQPATPQPLLVAGDAVTGFYRSTAASPRDPITVEAYSWGQLTSGARTARDVERALWTLLLPFALANVALHARPGIPADPDTERWASRSGLTAWLIRLFCLSLTGTVVLTFTGIGVDLIAWQCVDRSCLGRVPGPWEFLGQGWWHQGARSLAVGLLVPLGLLALLGIVAWRTYQYEAEMPADPARTPAAGPPAPAPADANVPTGQPGEAPPPPDPPPGPPTNPLQDPTFWCGEGQLRRAAVLHLCSGVVVAAAVPLGTVLALDPPRDGRAVAAWPTVALLVAVVVITLVALSRPWLTRRAGATPLGRWSIAVVVLTGLGLAGTILVLLLPDGPAGTPLADLRPSAGCTGTPGCGVDRSLPGFDWIIAWLGTAQLILLIAIGGAARSGRRALVAPAAATLLIVAGTFWRSGWLPGLPAVPWEPWQLAVPGIALATTGLLLPRSRQATGSRSPEPHSDLAWGGRAPAVVAGAGWLLCIAYCAGLLYWVTDRLNGAATPGGPPTVVPPIPVMWAGFCFATALLLLGAVAVRAVLLFHRLRRAEYAALAHDDRRLSAHELRRGREVATYRALHRLVGEQAVRLVGWYAAGILVLAAFGVAAVLSPTRPQVHPFHPADGGAAAVVAIADLGDALLGWLPVLIATLGLLVYRNDTVRRSVGVIWDLGTFWPRAAHPLAPPSYAERAVPELLTRTAGLLALPHQDPRRMDGIILSGHSQGTVICAAVVLQLPARWRRRIWFLSYGCQLTRLYGRVFPAYFGPDRLPALAEALARPCGTTGWTNFWRATDPLGWPVTAGERDMAVTDPQALHPSDGEVADPPIRSHSGYPDAAEFQRERSRVAWLLRQPVPSPRRGFD